VNSAELAEFRQKFTETKARACERWDDLNTGATPVIYVGAGSCGRAAGAMDVIAAVEETTERLKIRTRVLQVGCIGPCYLEPLMDIRKPGLPRLSYANVTAKKASEIVEAVLDRGETLKPVGYFGEQPFDGVDRFFDLPMMKPQVRIVLRNCGIIDPEEIDHYLARDGYEGFLKAVAMKPDELIQEVAASGIRGRGGAGFPTGRKWQTCYDQKADQKYIICNADEGDPGAFMNRSLLEGDPHAVLEGMMIAAHAIGASRGYIYARSEYPLAIKRLDKAISDARSLGLFNCFPDFEFAVKIKEGAGAFVCGEETALIASIEGKRGSPRPRPPFPAVAGLYGKPTIINNVETLGTLPNILRNGASWYAGHGAGKSKGTKTFSLVGKVKRTGLIEVPLGTTLRKVIFDIGGGPLNDAKPFKAVQTGGPSGGCLPAEYLDKPIDYENLAAAGSIMGSGGLIVMDQETCVVDIASYFLDFTQKESCGKCTPCRVGTRVMVDILKRIKEGDGEEDDLEKLERLGATMSKGSLCALGKSAPNPVITTIRYFRDEYLEHIHERRCRAGVCKEFITFFINSECTGCGVCLKACPSKAITGQKKEVHLLDTAKCIKCGVCKSVCQFDAVEVKSP
jgi:NADH-quinone oxidoreductase subunit F